MGGALVGRLGLISFHDCQTLLLLFRPRVMDVCRCAGIILHDHCIFGFLAILDIISISVAAI